MGKYQQETFKKAALSYDVLRKKINDDEYRAALGAAGVILRDDSMDRWTMARNLRTMSNNSQYLSPREGRIMGYRAAGLTFPEIAKIYGVTTERTRQIFEKAIEKALNKAKDIEYGNTDTRHRPVQPEESGADRAGR